MVNKIGFFAIDTQEKQHAQFFRGCKMFIYINIYVYIYVKCLFSH